MNATGNILTGVLAVALVLAVNRSRLELNHAKSGFRGCWAFVLFSLFRLATDGRIIPGGPFVSIHAEVLPALSCAVVLLFIARDFRTASAARRVGLSFLVLASVSIIAVAAMVIVLFCREPYARGVLVAW